MSKIYLFVSSSKQFITLFLTLGEGKKYLIRDFVNVILFVAKSTIIFNLTSLSIHKMQIFHAIFDQGFSFFVYILLMFYTAEFPEFF